jgi:hypothetical protein
VGRSFYRPSSRRPNQPKPKWQALAVEIERAKHLQAEAVESPSRLSDPLVSADIRWLTVFDRELDDVRTVAKSVDAGARLSAEELRSATETARKLLDILQKGRERAEAASQTAAVA